MGAVVRNLYLVNGRWKYRKVIPARLREHIDGGISEFVRWLGPAAGTRPTPEILRKLAAVEAECASLIAVAEKRASGQFDELNAEAVAHIIAQARSEMLEEDEEDRFDPAEDHLYEAIRAQLQARGVGANNASPDRRWSNRQENLEGALDFWRHEYARGQISDFVADEVRDRCAASGLYVDPASLGFRRLGRAYLALLIEVAEAGLKRQRGEVVPTPVPPAPKDADQLRGVPDQTITGLVADWWKEAERAGRTISTHEAYERVVRQFAAFLDHDDARPVAQQSQHRMYRPAPHPRAAEKPSGIS